MNCPDFRGISLGKSASRTYTSFSHFPFLPSTIQLINDMCSGVGGWELDLASCRIAQTDTKELATE